MKGPNNHGSYFFSKERGVDRWGDVRRGGGGEGGVNYTNHQSINIFKIKCKKIEVPKNS